MHVIFCLELEKDVILKNSVVGVFCFFLPKSEENIVNKKHAFINLIISKNAWTQIA